MSNSIYQKLINKETKLAVIGLGYVGLPIALEFARKVKVIGFDINKERVAMMRDHVDPSKELVASDFEGCDIQFTADFTFASKSNLSGGAKERLEQRTFNLVNTAQPRIL